MNELTELRAKLDEIDHQLTKLINERLSVVKNIGLYKKKNQIPVLDKGRENLIFEKMAQLSKDKDISEDLLKKIYIALLEESRRLQNEL